MQYLESRKYTIQAIFLIVAAIFLTRLFWLQLVDDHYKLAADNNAIRRIPLYPFRGLIYDRNGRLLVQNTPVYDLMVVPREVKTLDSARFCALFRIEQTTLRDGIRAARKFSKVRPSVLLPKLSTQDFAAVQDELMDFPGFYINARTERGYPHRSLSHALGYIGEISPQKLEDSAYATYRSGDYIGLTGLEAKYERFLMGRRGVKMSMVDVRGIEKGPYRAGAFDTAAVAGQDVQTTLDLKLQAYGEELMAGKVGSVVAIEPATGEVLTFISAPFYDPNLLTGKQYGNNYMALLRDPKRPLFDRPLMAVYPPGSIFKLVQAAVAMQQGVLTPETGYACNQNLVTCAHGHEPGRNLRIAIKHSCNPYFYQVFRSVINRHRSGNAYEDTRLGVEAWRPMVQSFGLAQRLGVDLPHEKMGLIASAKFYDKVYGYHRWKYPTIYSMSIGQGETGVTPLQMANIVTIMANRGFYYTPHLVRGIGRDALPLPEYRQKRFTAVDQKHFEPLIDGMQEVVDHGTGSFANLRKTANIVVCGKTGTAENPHGEDHAVFVAFAPRDNPKIAIAVYVENAGFGALSAAPLAGCMIEKYLTDSISPGRKRWEDWVKAGNFKPKHKH